MPTITGMQWPEKWDERPCAFYDFLEEGCKCTPCFMWDHLMRWMLGGFMAALIGTVWVAAAGDTPPYEAKVAPASKEAETVMQRISVPADLKISLWAAEPMLANPVCFCFDERGRMFVAETFRLHDGVTDIRGHMDWLNDDLACRTVADRLAMYQRKLGKRFANYGVHHDRIRLLEDTTGSGKAGRASVFADGFNAPEAGIGAGLLASRGRVWWTCIPSLWLLEEKNGSGKADRRTALHEGYGVHVGFIGHDLHGLTIGPDGKLYFSIGDRGLHVVLPDRIVSNPDSGAVLRCNPDGSDLELFATGLRNPQELAFDQYGNLFTVDNNSDGGDQARVTYLVEGADHGWRIGYQFIEKPTARGMWNAEKLWVPEEGTKAAYAVPPLLNLSDGPSGLVFNPGKSLPPQYDNHFFLADFRGGSANSGIRSFAVAPKGAGFEVVDAQQPIWGTLVTDVDFGPDGALYFSDWVDGWGKTGKGRIYRIQDPERMQRPDVKEVAEFLAKGVLQKTIVELCHYLKHADRRVRLAAQFQIVALAEKAYFERPRTEAQIIGQVLGNLANNAELAVLPRLHALWALGQIAATDPRLYEFPILNLLESTEPELRAQAAKLLGAAPATVAADDALMQRLADAAPRVRFFAAQALGQRKCSQAVTPLKRLLAENDHRDPFVRHAATLALARIGKLDDLLRGIQDEPPAVRLGAVVALRRHADVRLADFLGDPDPAVVHEALRAIVDVPVEAAMPKAAALPYRSDLPETGWRRVLNANFRGGAPSQAQRLAELAARADISELLRLEALYFLENWAKPSPRDRLVGLWRPLPARSPDPAVSAFKGAFAKMLTTATPKIRERVVALAGQFGLKEVAAELASMFDDPAQPPAVRTEALAAIVALNDARAATLLDAALRDPLPAVRAKALPLLAERDPDSAMAAMKRALADGSIPEKQATLVNLHRLKLPQAAELLAAAVELQEQSRLPAEAQLELHEAVAKLGSKELQTRVKPSKPADVPTPYFRELLVGGDADRGRSLFLGKTEISCMRCHKVHGQGGEVGPDLSKIGGQQTREYLLEALVLPNKAVAKGFETVVLELSSGKIVTGVLKGEDANEVRLITAEAKTLSVKKSEIEQRASGPSSMPADLHKHLTPFELRDLVEFLANLK
jgi:quinoprotein glucose dehydrogenase